MQHAPCLPANQPSRIADVTSVLDLAAIRVRVRVSVRVRPCPSVSVRVSVRVRVSEDAWERRGGEGGYK
jgi:hypothetical protein